MSLSACQPAQEQADTDGAIALREAGYTRAPQVTTVTQPTDQTFLVTGEATPNGRVRLAYQAQNPAGRLTESAVGVVADSRGRFTAEVPSGPLGGIYDLYNDDRGRLMHAEGRLFIPLDHPEKAAMLRPGGASSPLRGSTSAISVVDYDSAGGLALAGKVTPQTPVTLSADGVVIGQVSSDAEGRYGLTAQMVMPTDEALAIALGVEAGGNTASRTIPVSRPQSSDQIMSLNPGWRIDWALPGGGIQTTIVY